MQGLFLLALPLLCLFKSFWLVFIVLIPFGFIQGIAQSSTFAFAGQLPFRYMAALMFGQGLGALGCNVIRAITLEVWPPYINTVADEHNAFVGAIVFFSITVIIVWFTSCLMSCVLQKNECGRFLCGELMDAHLDL